MKLLDKTKLAVAGATLPLANMAQAAVETAGVTSAIAEAGTAISVVGAAVLVMMVGAKVWKWIQRAL